MDLASVPAAYPLQSVSSGMKVSITDRALAQIGALADAYAPLETGGVLLGWRDGENKVVAGIIGPGPRALHGRYTFVPDDRWHSAQIDKAFEVSSGDLDYLGDWHTHPDGGLAMSMLDRSTLSRLVRKNAGAIMMIAASGENQWRFGAWSQRRGRLWPRPTPTACDMLSIDTPSTWPTFEEGPYPILAEGKPYRAWP